MAQGLAFNDAKRTEERGGIKWAAMQHWWGSFGKEIPSF